MPKKVKKGKKGKKEKKLAGPAPVTTVQIIQDRTKMLCPRMGDAYNRSLNVEGILEDVVDNYLYKAVDKQSDSLSLIAMKMKRLPDIKVHISQLQCLTNLNLSKNNLFNGDELFMVSFLFCSFQLSALVHRPHLLTSLFLLTQALAGLQNLTQLNLSENFLNGVLSEHAGKLTKLETINMDINNITVLCPEVRNWTNLKIFTISDNSLSGAFIMLHCFASLCTCVIC